MGRVKGVKNRSILKSKAVDAQKDAQKKVISNKGKRLHCPVSLDTIKEQLGKDSNIIYLEDLSPGIWEKQLGPKRWCDADKKLSRILKQGGTVVINTDTCNPKELLTFNAIEAMTSGILNGIGDGPIQVNENCKFVFVGTNIDNQQADFKSRGLWCASDALTKIIPSPVLRDLQKLSVEVIDESRISDKNIPVFNVQNRDPKDWKNWLKQADISGSNAKYPNIESAITNNQSETIYITGVSPDFSEDQFPNDLSKFLVKRNITKVVIVKDPPVIQSDKKPFNSTIPTIVADKDTLVQLLNAPSVDEEGLLFVGNALQTYKKPLQLVITEALDPQYWYQLRQLPNIQVYQPSEAGDQRLNENQNHETHYKLVMGDSEFIQANEFYPKNSERALSQEGIELKDVGLIVDGCESTEQTLLGHFDQKPHGLVSKMALGETVEVYVPDVTNPPESLRPLLGASPWAILNGELTLLPGRIILKSSEVLAQKESKNITIEDTEIHSLGEHGKKYLNAVQSQLNNHRYVAVHGDAACGKSHLSRQLNKPFFLGDISQATTPNDIQADPAFKKWLEEGNRQESVLVIDEYNLANPGVFDCLKGTHINLNEELIELTNNHKVLFLGNKATETGRNNHPNLIDSIVTMTPPKPDWVVDHCMQSSEIDNDLKDRLIEHVKAGASIRDIQTFFGMYNLDTVTADAMVFQPEIKLSELRPTVENFLGYVEQAPTGNRVLYITGEPGCGKDRTINAVLSEKNLSYKTITLGQHMNIDQFKQMFDTAYKKGTVLVVSELSAAPSAVLEYMNGKLAERPNNQFCLIATDNAGFKGREPLSEPLKSRLICKTIQPVIREEFEKTFPNQHQALVDTHFKLQNQDSTVSLRQLHTGLRLMDELGDFGLDSMIPLLYGQALADDLKKQEAQQEKNINSFPTSINLYNQSTQDIGHQSMIGKCDDVKNGYLIGALYDHNGDKIDLVPSIASLSQQDNKQASVKWNDSGEVAYPVFNHDDVSEDTNSQSLTDLLRIETSNPTDFAKQVAGFIRRNYRYSVDADTTNQVKRLLKENNDLNDLNDLSKIQFLNCDTATLLFINIMKSKFPDFSIYYGIGWRIQNGSITSIRHVQPVWKDSDSIQTLDPTPTHMSEDDATKKFVEEQNALINQASASTINPTPTCMEANDETDLQEDTIKECIEILWNKVLDTQTEEIIPTSVPGTILNIDRTISTGRINRDHKGLISKPYSKELSALSLLFDTMEDVQEDVHSLLKDIQLDSTESQKIRSMINSNIYMHEKIAQYLPKELLEKKQFVANALEINPHVFQYASEKLRGDREVVLKALKNWVHALEYASEELKGNREVVMAAVKQGGCALEYASEELKRDHEVVLAAVRQDGCALEYASKKLKTNHGVVMAAVKQDGNALRYASEELKGNRDVVMAAVKQDGHALVHASDKLKGDCGVVMAAVQQDGQALVHASDKLKGDRGVVMAAVKQGGCALEYASEALKDDCYVVMEAVKNASWAFNYASNRLKSDPVMNLSSRSTESVKNLNHMQA